MMTKSDASIPVQANLFKVLLRDIVYPQHELILLRDAIDWGRFEKVLEPVYCQNNGRPSIPVRTMVGLMMLRTMYGLSDQEVLDGWVENPYWQSFCGGAVFEHEPPTDQSIMSRWRSQVGETGVAEMLKESVARSRRLLAQDRDTPGKDKINSFHEPQVECIAKGKVHTRHEFGVKAGFVTASRTNWVLGAMAIPGNPYDGNTLAEVLKQAESICGTKPEHAYCDLGQRAHPCRLAWTPRDCHREAVRYDCLSQSRRPSPCQGNRNRGRNDRCPQFEDLQHLRADRCRRTVGHGASQSLLDLGGVRVRSPRTRGVP